MTVPRYYAQHCELGPFLGADDSGWQIFDREFTDNRGQCRAIALAGDRAAAFKIRDALNAAEELDQTARLAAMKGLASFPIHIKAKKKD